MKTKIALSATLLSLFFCFRGFAGSGPESVGLMQSIILFPTAPNPCDSKTLVRVYLPQKDANAAIKIYNSDSTLVKSVSLAAESGIGSAIINLSDLEPGNYTYKLFYLTETRYTRALSIKRAVAAVQEEK